MIDVNSSTWITIKKFLDSEREQAQGLVNDPDTSENMTNVNRGILRLSEDLLNMPNRKAPAITTEEV